MYNDPVQECDFNRFKAQHERELESLKRETERLREQVHNHDLFLSFAKTTAFCVAVFLAFIGWMNLIKPPKPITHPACETLPK